MCNPQSSQAVDGHLLPLITTAGYPEGMLYQYMNKHQAKLEALGQYITPPRHVLPVSQYGSVSGLPPKFSHLFIGPLPIFSENFMQIRLEVFAQSC